ncbi:hypothetical protein [Apilactobacillus xinyiensis]|nr:hypothetical protein [Apilactobacillus xinyiensis]
MMRTPKVVQLFNSDINAIIKLWVSNNCRTSIKTLTKIIVDKVNYY